MYVSAIDGIISYKRDSYAIFDFFKAPDKWGEVPKKYSLPKKPPIDFCLKRKLREQTQL